MVFVTNRFEILDQVFVVLCHEENKGTLFNVFLHTLYDHFPEFCTIFLNFRLEEEVVLFHS